MKLCKRIALLAVAVAILLTVAGSYYDLTQYTQLEIVNTRAEENGGHDGTLAEIPENTRSAYNVANCHTLEGAPYVMVIFLDDDVSSWSEDKVLAYWDALLIPGVTFLEENAANWGVELDFDMGYYATYGHPDRPVRYKGVVKTHADGEISDDILEQAALSLGFSSKYHMHERLQEYSGQEQVAYVIMLNKGGRSYTIRYSDLEQTETRRKQNLEYCVIYTGFTDDSGDTSSDTIAHEMLHLFGAEDYYRPESREALARELYPEDIMLCDMPDLRYFTLGEMTAYCVGWTDEAPDVCRNPQWWQ